MTEQRTSYFLAGFIEGVFAPVIELVIGIFIGVTVTISNVISSATGVVDLFNPSLIFTIIFIVDTIRNIISCFSHSSIAIGNVAGNIIGLFIFYGAINYVSPESANSSVFWTIIMAISLAIGIVITIWQKSRDIGNDYL